MWTDGYIMNYNVIAIELY